MNNQLYIFRIICLLLAACWLTAAAATRVQGDVNGDGRVTISDVTSMIDLLIGNNDSYIDPQLDVDGDGSFNITDVSTLIDMLLTGDVPPVEPVKVEVNGVTFVMVPVQGGTFTMGASYDETEYARRNEYPPHEVTLSGYYISQTEVTWEQWLAVTEGDTAGFEGDLQGPVVNVNQFDCCRFVDKLTELTGKVFRMPTEAEWEFAARGGEGGVRLLFAGSNEADEVAWYYENSDGRPHTVATKLPNSLGIYDMSGNVLEWCQDFYYHYSYDPQVNPVGPESGYTNVVRGGGWDWDYMSCRVTCRNSYDPNERANNLGLRIAMNM